MPGDRSHLSNASLRVIAWTSCSRHGRPACTSEVRRLVSGAAKPLRNIIQHKRKANLKSNGLKNANVGGCGGSAVQVLVIRYLFVLAHHGHPNLRPRWRARPCETVRRAAWRGEGGGRPWATLHLTAYPCGLSGTVWTTLPVRGSRMRQSLAAPCEPKRRRARASRFSRQACRLASLSARGTRGLRKPAIA